MKTRNVRTAFIAVTAALIVLPAAAGGLIGGGSLGGTLGSQMGGPLGSSIGGDGMANGNGQGAFGSRLGSGLHGATERVGTAKDKVKSGGARVQDKANSATQAIRDSDPSIAGDGALGGTTGVETAKHEVLLGGDGAGAAKADRSGLDASLTPDATAKAGRKPAPVEATPAATPAN